jgi:hypothetical protein
MNRRTVWSLALAALVTAFMAVDASARTIVPTPNLSGTWRLDQRHSDRNFGRGFGNGYRGNGAAISDLALPRAVQIVQGPNRLRVTNRRGEVVQVILLDDHFGFGGRDRFDNNGRFGNNGPFDNSRSDDWNGYRNQSSRDVLVGQWHGPLLVAEQTGARGTQVTQTFRLANGGRTLVVRTEVARGRSGATMKMEQVFQRA